MITGKIPKKGVSKAAHITAYMEHYPFSGQQRKKDCRKSIEKNRVEKEVICHITKE